MMEIRKFTILPRLPDRLQSLGNLFRNYWWSWNPDAILLLRRMDPDLYSAVGHNPIKMLGVIDQRRLDELAADSGFTTHLDRLANELQAYLLKKTWFDQTHPEASHLRVAYFSAEFGLHESFPIYSGGLGILAGDHLKAASDLGIPLVGVGLLYQQGYFRQYLNVDGWQQERYPENDFYNMPCEQVMDAHEKPLIVQVEYPHRLVHARVWKVAVGRVPLYLLDTNIPSNNAEDRQITAQLYGGDQDMRIRQELMLGVGGLRALRAMGIDPSICHMNEGHSAFLAIERVCTVMEQQNVDFATARQLVAAGCVFTTHTPVEAGNDMFPHYLVEQYLEPFTRRMKLDLQHFLGLGRQRPDDRGEPFCMTVLALRLANFANGVSKLHSKVSRRMWRNIWPELPEDDVPIDSITNGVHVPSFLCAEMHQLYDRYLGPGWMDRLDDTALWKRVEHIPDAELWRTHERRRDRLVEFCRRRLARQLTARGCPAREVAMADEVLDPNALTIGFARRFATYKRATLIFRNIERFAQLVNNTKRPVQLIIAGKAHPKDHGGKELIAQIVHISRREEFRRRVVFIEDYDMNVARYLVQGVDLWLNNPRRPLEASGTSGMKGPPNGSLNFSVLDGWWCEGFNTNNGWAIGHGEEYSDLNYQDEVESRSIYDLLEKEIVSLFYERAGDGLPRGWIQRMKQSIMSVVPMFNTGRMVREYTEKFYLPALERFTCLAADKMLKGRELAAWMHKVERQWARVKIDEVQMIKQDPIQVGVLLKVVANIQLGELSPEDVNVEIYHGDLDALGAINAASVVGMNGNGRAPNSGSYTFTGELPCKTSGQHGFAVRVVPRHPMLARKFLPALIRWG